MKKPNTGSDDSATRVRQWRLGRIDIRSPVVPNPWPVARLELEHPERGRVTDIGKAPGAFDAAFVAASQILGVSPKLLSYTVSSGEITPEGALSIVVEVELDFEGDIIPAPPQVLIWCDARWKRGLTQWLSILMSGHRPQFRSVRQRTLC